MADVPDAKAIEAQARTLLDERVEKVRELASTQAAVVYLQERHDEELAAVLVDHTSAYAAATKAGWSDQDLKKLGLSREAGRPPKRSRRSRGGGPKDAPSTSAETANGGTENG